MSCMSFAEENGASLSFDYSPWQRTERKVQSSKISSQSLLKKQPQTIPSSISRRDTSHNPLFLKGSKRSPPSCSSQVTLPDPVVENLFPNLHKECSTLCRHGIRPKTPGISQPEKRRSKDGSIALLKLLIKERKLALQANKERYMKLIRENIRLKEEISTFEDINHADVSELLTKYKKYQGALAVMNRKHVLTLKQEEMEYHETQNKIDQMLRVSKRDLELLDAQIGEEKHALNVLHNYKEKEYPDKLEKIKHLLYEIEKLEVSFQADLDDITKKADVEKDSYLLGANNSQLKMKTVLAEFAVVTMDESVKEMANQNVLLKKEIEFHRKEFEKHGQEITTLEHEIRKLKENETMRSSMRRYPELFTEKCLPETEFELRIPKQRYLPI